ncbi:MAG TPA: hypothetical protein VEK11_17495 [Thermoanaerobaculia bacterium]|jgi:drug/metabolite transporter (DMT)-like permease|nr:hypothetical protein [Thermoanaerobaculia bacterium]
MSARRARAARLQKLVHFLTAFTMILKGVSKLDHPEGYWPLILFFFATGIYIAAITLMHERLHTHTRLLDATVYALESVATGAIAWLYALEKTQGLQYVFGLASLLFAIVCAVRLFRRSPQDH